MTVEESARLDDGDGSAPSAVSADRPAKRVSAASAVYSVLHTEIVGMVLAPGMPLNEKALVERFGTSRTPVREALIRLVEDDLVEILPRFVTRVTRIRLAAIREAAIIRQSLEVTTVEQAARVATDHDVTSLDEVLSQQRLFLARGDLLSFHDADETFHGAIADIAGLPGIWTYLKAARAQISRPRRLSLPAFGRAQAALDEHGQIRDAIAVHDANAAAKAVRFHLDALLPDLQELRRRSPGYFV